MKISDLPREQIPWYPSIDREKCTGCRTCVEFCRNGAFGFDEETGKAEVVHAFNCVVACSSCEARCPAGAISFPPLSILRDLTKR